MMTEQQLIENIKQGDKPYCLLSYMKYEYEDVSPYSFVNDGNVDGYLEVEESPFKFPVFYIEHGRKNSLHDRTYYRTAIPVDKNRMRI